jgi:hypothetical protein
MSGPDVGRVGRVLLAAGTGSYDSSEFGSLDKVPDSLRVVVTTLAGLGFATVGAAPGYQLDPALTDFRASVREAANSAPVVVLYYTGHGVHPELDTYYLVGRASQPRDFSGTALAATELPRLLIRVDEAGQVFGNQPQALVILDCCYSGRAGMEMLGEALRGIGNPRLWVIASAGALEYAQQGRFAAAFCDALNRPTTGPSTQFLSLESIVQVINDARTDRGGQEARLFLPAAGSAGIPPFFPNKLYRPGLAGRTVSEQHWLSRVRGAPDESTTGFYLTGRTGRIRAVEDLVGWMTVPGGGLAVVTGGPGTGKSALLALPVLLAQPSRRADLLAGASVGSLIERAATQFPADAPLAAVHARGLNADQAAGVIAEALGLVPGSARTLLKDLEDNAQPGAVVVVDALDEALSPMDMVDDLLLPLSNQADMRVVVGSRRHAVPRGAELTIDLDRPRYKDPEALSDYLGQLLAATEEPDVRTPYQAVPEEVTAAVAAAIAHRATSSDGRTESFLIGRILALSVRGRPEPADVTGRDWQAALPSELTEAFDEDLSRLGDRAPVVRTLLEALAWAQGPGLPWENIWVPVARALAGPHRSPISNDDVRWLLDKAGAYVVEDLGPGQRSVYRPFHDVLAAYLRGESLDTGREAPDKPAIDEAWAKRRLETEEVITNALLATVPVDARGEIQWDSAHPYLQTYLMQHAADARRETKTALVQDEGFLAVTDRVTFSPYQGLRPFDEASAPLFFGREAETSQLVARLSDRLTKPGPIIVSGAPGVGKTSLLRAGLLPVLARGGLNAGDAPSWPRVLMMTPTSRPMHELAARMAALTDFSPDELLVSLRVDPTQTTERIRQALIAEGPQLVNTAPRLVLIVDQFEEVFTHAAHDELERRAFIKALAAAAGTGGSEPGQAPLALVVLGVRAEFEARCAEYPELAEAVQDRYLVPPMTPSQLRLVITEPVRAAGLQIDAALVQKLVGDAELGLSSGLAIVQFALDQIWRGRSGAILTLDDYERVGGAIGAIAAVAEECYSRLTMNQQTEARRLFMTLASVNADTGRVSARPVSVDELTRSMPEGQTKDLLAVISSFSDAHFLVHESKLGRETIAISLEALLTAWPRLRLWIDESRAALIVRTRLGQAAVQWAHFDHDPSYLYKDTELWSTQDAVLQMETHQITLHPEEVEFLHASTLGDVRRKRRRRRARAVLVTLLIVMLLGLITESVILIMR